MSLTPRDGFTNTNGRPQEQDELLRWVAELYYLRQQGADVTILESNTVGSGASWGNGGWLCPAQAGPLPEPGLTWFGIRSLFDRSSALYFQLSKLPQLTPWLLRFMTYCNARDHKHGVESQIEVVGNPTAAP